MTLHYLVVLGMQCLSTPKLELLTDQDMFLFVEKGIRGGLSQVCSKRRSKASNRFLPSYDPSKPTSYVI